MKIKLISVGPDSACSIVDFSCAIGKTSALWKSENIKPVLGHEYDVEFDVNAVLELGKNASVESAGKPALCMNGTQVQVTGIVESLDADGMAYLRLSPDCLVMVEMTEPANLVGNVLCIVVDVTAFQVTAIGINSEK